MLNLKLNKVFSVFRKVLNVFSVILLVFTFSLVVFLTITRIQGNTPELFGYQIFRISSSSMSPELEIGDIILSKRVKDVTSVSVGDIITYKGEFGGYEGKKITHEVVVAPYLADGTYYLQTQGIANNYIDPEISEDQIIGKLVCKAPILASMYNFFVTPYGLIIVLGFLLLLFVNELYALLKLSKKENKSSETQIITEEPDIK